MDINYKNKIYIYKFTIKLWYKKENIFKNCEIENKPTKNIPLFKKIIKILRKYNRIKREKKNIEPF
jgi:hypothetical protein